MIFEQPFDITFVTTFFFLFLLVKNNGERKEKRENNVNMRDKVFKKLSKSGCTN